MGEERGWFQPGRSHPIAVLGAFGEIPGEKEPGWCQGTGVELRAHAKVPTLRRQFAKSREPKYISSNNGTEKRKCFHSNLSDMQNNERLNNKGSSLAKHAPWSSRTDT